MLAELWQRFVDLFTNFPSFFFFQIGRSVLPLTVLVLDSVLSTLEKKIRKGNKVKVDDREMNLVIHDTHI